MYDWKTVSAGQYRDGEILDLLFACFCLRGELRCRSQCGSERPGNLYVLHDNMGYGRLQQQGWQGCKQVLFILTGGYISQSQSRGDVVEQIIKIRKVDIKPRIQVIVEKAAGNQLLFCIIV